MKGVNFSFWDQSLAFLSSFPFVQYRYPRGVGGRWGFGGAQFWFGFFGAKHFWELSLFVLDMIRSAHWEA